jgi:hypothetical protein
MNYLAFRLECLSGLSSMNGTSLWTKSRIAS